MEKNYTAFGLIFGVVLGVGIGVASDNLAIWLSLGIGAGLALGSGFQTYANGNKKNCVFRKSNH